ncbi:hypothetical protein [Notoacmeibacter sp. MSK16QG-6]|uniref:hypothetical protein n=1 Tax=Notoacmeibacter sp. MSK16QG-6 TaxID=2957982 RepID=UPI0020A054EA|nr:hypothetical protein [Notoacmeibacter sp. MSK16QG-6]MCP1200931.1 hypothetical protein [Notoacmeibacter sp. MSK16QG-6]
MTRGRLQKTGLSFLAAGLCVAAPASAVQDSSIDDALSPPAMHSVGTARKSGRLIPFQEARFDTPVHLASETTAVIVPDQPLPPKLDEALQPLAPSMERDTKAVITEKKATESINAPPEDPSKAAKMQFDAFITGLFEFQDAIISGDPSALALQGKVLHRLQINLLSDRQLFEREDAPVESLLIFALSGGDARVSVDLLGRVPPTHPLYALSHSVIGYLKGNPDSAENLFDHNPAEYAFPLGALLALSTGTANARVDGDVARRSLEIAAILGTGTLVEEVALRRLLDIHAEMNDGDAFFAVAESYGLRFPKSIFLSEFARRLSVTLTEHDWVPPNGLAAILERINPQQSILVAREIARGAAIKGNHELALMAIDWLRRSGESNADDQLYEAMAHLAARNVEEAKKIDEAITTDTLSRRDRMLLASMRRALAHIQGVAPPIAELTALMKPDHMSEPVLKAELHPDHRARMDQLAGAKAVPVSTSMPSEPEADPELVSLRNRLSATLNAIEQLSEQ